MQWQSLEPSLELYGLYTEEFRRMPSIVARSFQFTPAETLQFRTFAFNPAIERQIQSDAQPSDHEQISTDLLHLEENLGSVTGTTQISNHPSKTSALLRMKMKFMRARHQLPQSEEENKHLKCVIEKAHDSANPIGQLDVDEDNEDDEDASNINMDLSHAIIHELAILLDIEPQQRRFSTELYQICSCIQTVSPAAYRDPARSPPLAKLSSD
jgi:hypothetical protein